jgi:uncharacterized Tic20 family protein
MYCPSCGEEVAEDSRYCSRCGERVDGGRGSSGTDTSEASGWDTATGTGTGAGTATPSTPHGDTTMAALTHLLALVTWILGPLVVYIVTEDEFTKENSRNAINWQIAFTLYTVVSAILVLLLVGFLFLAVLGILNLVFCVVAAVKASDGEEWKYPFTPDIV